MRPGTPRTSPAAPAAVVLALSLANGALAQSSADAAFGLRLRPDTMQPGPGREAFRASAETQALVPLADARLAGARWIGDSVRLEVPRDTVTGQYARPRFVVGLPSESMRSWMHMAGVDADHCMLPMLRTRTRMTAEGDVSGTLWLYARCTFR